MSIGIFIIWWLVASALLWLTWNHTINGIFKVKQTRFRHAALLVATLSVLMMPKYYMNKVERSHHCCPFKTCTHSGAMGSEKGDCPYSRHGEQKETAPH